MLVHGYHHLALRQFRTIAKMHIPTGRYYVSQFTVETYCFAYGRCLFKQPQSVIPLESV